MFGGNRVSWLFRIWSVFRTVVFRASRGRRFSQGLGPQGYLLFSPTNTQSDCLEGQAGDLVSVFTTAGQKLERRHEVDV